MKLIIKIHFVKNIIKIQKKNDLGLSNLVVKKNIHQENSYPRGFDIAYLFKKYFFSYFIAYYNYYFLYTFLFERSCKT